MKHTRGADGAGDRCGHVKLAPQGVQGEPPGSRGGRLRLLEVDVVDGEIPVREEDLKPSLLFFPECFLVRVE